MSDAVTIQLTPMKPSSCSNGSAGSTRAATVRSAIKLNSGCYGTYTGRSNRTSWHHSIRSTNDSSHKHGVECATQKTDRPHSKRKPGRTFACASVRECPRASGVATACLTRLDDQGSRPSTQGCCRGKSSPGGAPSVAGHRTGRLLHLLSKPRTPD
jgi:hypothetical protein